MEHGKRGKRKEGRRDGLAGTGEREGGRAYFHRHGQLTEHIPMLQLINATLNNKF